MRESISIIFYMHDFSGGGVERMRVNLAAGFHRLGWHVTFVVDESGGPLRSYVPRGVGVISLGSGSTVAHARRLALILRHLRPSFLVASLDHNNIAALLASLLARVDTRIFICQHNSLSREAEVGWKYKLVPFCYRALAPWAAGIIAVSNGVARDLVATTGIRPDRITTIYNPVIVNALDKTDVGVAPHPWLEKPSGPIFVFVGRLVSQKDPRTLLNAFALQKNPMARLILLGEGPLRLLLDDLAVTLCVRDRVFFAGFQDDPSPWIRRADALILSSRYEGFANVIVEALHCGTPVIATDCESGPAEILGNGTYGTLVPVNDPIALSDAMTKHSKADFSKAVLRGRAADFSVEACVESHLALFAKRDESTRIIFGLKFTKMKAHQIVALVLSPLLGGHARLVVTPNADHIRLLRNREFAAACGAADIVCPDGFPVALYAWLRGLGNLGRVTGCDILRELMRHPSFHQCRVFVLLEGAETASSLHVWAARCELGGRLRVEIAPPNFLADQRAQEDLASSIRAFGASILLITLGAPVSEVFAYRQRMLLPSCWVLCIGQALRVELGITSRAPALFRIVPLEWLWRLIHEPRRLAGRYLKDAFWFPYAVVVDVFGKRKAPRTGRPVA